MIGLPRYSGRRLKAAWLRWLTSYRIERQFDEAKFTHPIFWFNDDPKAIKLGRHVSIGPFCEIAVLASNPKSSIHGELCIGNYSAIGAQCNIRASGGAIRIGDNCLIGQSVSLIASNHQIKRGSLYWQLPWDETKTGITIGDNVWIGCDVTILPGCNVGDHAVVGAGSIVTKNIPSSTIWAGNPARQLRTIS